MEEEKVIKCWILLALSNTSKDKGLNSVELFSNSPPPSVNLDLTKLYTHVRMLQRQGYIESFETIGESFTITAKGKKELRRLLKSDPDEYKPLIKCFPEMELRKKIENSESFIFGAVLLVVSYFMLVNNVTTNPYLNYLIIAVMFFSFGFAAASFLTIISSVIEKLKISLFYGLSDFLEDNKDWIGYGLIILATIVGLFILKIYDEYTTKQIVGILIVELLATLILKWKEIVNYFKSIRWIK